MTSTLMSSTCIQQMCQHFDCALWLNHVADINSVISGKYSINICHELFPRFDQYPPIATRSTRYGNTANIVATAKCTSRNRVSFSTHGYLRLSKADVYLARPRVGDIIISRCGKGRWKVQSSRLMLVCEGSPARPFAQRAQHRRQRLIVAMSIEISRDNGARRTLRRIVVVRESVLASRAPACGCLRKISEESPFQSAGFSSPRGDHAL